MSRLTEKDKNRIVIMTKPLEANNKLADLEDVLEEFGIESAEELKELLNKQKRTIKTLNNYNKQGQTIMAENEELKSQLSKAIVPKFMIGQEIWYIYGNEIKSMVVDSIEICGKPPVFVIYKDISMSWGQIEQNCFPTEAEAQAKLDEIRRK